MGKFKKKFEEFVSERKQNVTGFAHAGTFMTIDKRYKVFNKGINGFVKGKPTKQEQLAFTTLWKFPAYGIDKKYNMGARTRCKLMSKRFKKEKIVLKEDKVFLKKELIPYIKESYERETGNLYDLLGGISNKEAKEGYDLYKKNEKAINGRGLK